jgi:mono/diheme cytochrome c family protein
VARLLEMAPSGTADRLLGGIGAGLEQGPPVRQVPPRLLAVIGRMWSGQPHTGALLDVAARLGHPPAVRAARASANTRPGGSSADRGAAPAASEEGREAFLTHCSPCHQTDGSGMARLGAPLRQSQWVLGHEDLLTRIVLNGLRGELLMPPMGTLDDRQLAAILSYVRGAWGHAAAPVSPETVARVRAASAARQAPWTRQELAALGLPD